jgi:chromosome segregation ATPase
VYHKGELLDVLVLSDAEQRLKIKNIELKDKIRFECKLLGTKQQFLGSVSFSADKLLALSFDESWSQPFPLFGEGEPDESHRAFGDAQVAPPCILLTFQLAGLNAPSPTSGAKASRPSGAQTRTSGKKAPRKGNGPAKGRGKGAQAAPGKAVPLEERVEAAADQLTGDMGKIQNDDKTMITSLDTLDTHVEAFSNTHESDIQKNNNVKNFFQQLMAAIEEMKTADKEDVDELSQMKEQLDNDVTAASSDIKVLMSDTKDLNDYISEKSGETYDSENGTTSSKQKAVRSFLLNTLKVSDEQLNEILNENLVLRNKVKALRSEVRNKFLDNQGTTDEEINELLHQYEELLDQHADVFKQLDEESNKNVDEFEKFGEMWKTLFSEGMDLEKKCDDIDYQIEQLMDKENQLRRFKGDLENNYADYLGKIRYIVEQQKNILDEIRSDIDSLRQEITSLKRQHEEGSAELKALSVAYARGRNTQNDPNLENVLSDFIAVHQHKRKAQDNGEGLYDDMVEGHKTFLNNAYGEYERGSKDKATAMRIDDLMKQILQSNQDIELLLADLQRIDREKAINEHRNIL